MSDHNSKKIQKKENKFGVIAIAVIIAIFAFCLGATLSKCIES